MTGGTKATYYNNTADRVLFKGENLTTLSKVFTAYYRLLKLFSIKN